MLSIAEIKKGLFSYQEAKRGFLAIIKTPADLLKAAEKVKEARVQNFDCFTPFPIHGLDHAMGIHRSWIPVLTFIGGATGLTLSLAYITWIDVFNWSIVYGGKPFWSIPAYFPILFEMMIYFAAVFTVAAVIVLGRLGYINRKPVTPNITCDEFAIWLGDANLTRSDVERIFSGIPVEIRENKD